MHMHSLPLKPLIKTMKTLCQACNAPTLLSRSFLRCDALPGLFFYPKAIDSKTGNHGSCHCIHILKEAAAETGRYQAHIGHDSQQSVLYVDLPPQVHGVAASQNQSNAPARNQTSGLAEHCRETNSGVSVKRTYSLQSMSQQKHHLTPGPPTPLAPLVPARRSTPDSPPELLAWQDTWDPAIYLELVWEGLDPQGGQEVESAFWINVRRTEELKIRTVLFPRGPNRRYVYSTL